LVQIGQILSVVEVFVKGEKQTGEFE
jgi:hypothetical protein